METKINEMERDDSNIRLFIFRLQKKGLTIRRLHAVNKNVYICDTNHGLKVLKRFESKSRLLFQLEFSQQILKRSERVLYYFERFPNGARYVKWKNFYWAMMPFILGNKVNFAQKTDQVDVFHALNEFHQQSFGIQMDFFSVRRLYPYYEQRFQNFSRLMKYVPDLQTTMFEEIKHWGAYALNKLSQARLEEMENGAIAKRMWLHGDVAHHNFLRVEKQRVVLIDFDLVSIGPKEYDQLQLSQRILCYNGWNFDELIRTVSAVQTLANQRWYLYGLIFPNDIYREWVYFFHRKTRISIELLLKYTINQYAARLSFIKEMLRVLN